MPIVVDSSGWIEYFVDGPNADHFASAIEKTEDLIVPSIILTEVYRWMLRNSSESEALTVLAVMKQAKVTDLDAFHAVASAELSHKHKLPLAAGIIYTTARQCGADLITQDADLEKLEGVTYITHPNRKR
ncbi:MAG: type II toxin-antitoxin system VapC family toxin [Akkermansiaceae bacterium]